jgi:transposase
MRRRRRAYPTDLTDAQWAAISELVPDALPGGRPRRASSRALVNAILYMLRGGQAWRLLPHDFPPWQTVYYYLRRWQAEGVWERIHHAVLVADRERTGRDASPTAAIIDSQSVRTGDQKGARAATTRARRSRGASATS